MVQHMSQTDGGGGAVTLWKSFFLVTLEATASDQHILHLLWWLGKVYLGLKGLYGTAIIDKLQI